MVMDPIFQVGKNSVTPENIAAIGQALDKRELIKISVLQNCEDDAREIAECIAERTRSQVVQVIGKKIVLYKEGKDDKKKIELPKAKKMHKKIGILGGTFDPFHRGHFMLAETAYRQFSLDEVWILPNGNPPHKKEIEQTDFETRCEMISLAIEDTPSMKLCEVESSEDCYHYTYQTLMYLTEKHPDCRFFSSSVQIR